MSKKPLKKLIILQILVLILFLTLTTTNEILDLPHLLMGDQATTWNQRSGEIAIEVVIFSLIIALEVVLFRRLFDRIRILEGFLPICASCKKIRSENQWEQIEAYISRHSLVSFSHSICPDCREKLYPELRGSKD